MALQLRQRDPAGVSKTNIKGWQSANNLQHLPEFEAINLRILQVCERITESQHFKSDFVLQHQAWLNISPPGASNQIHYHPNCHFSGVYYVSLEAPDCGSIVGIYLWDDRGSADAFYTPAWVEAVTRKWGAPPERLDWETPLVVESRDGRLVRG